MKKRAFVKYTKAGLIVPGSLIITNGSYPDGSALWKEVTADLCCDDLCPDPPEPIVFCMENWTFENFDGTTYRNGDSIPQVTDPIAWGNLTTGAWCYYNNDPANGPIYGKLYNWFAVNDPRGLAPVGYRVPTVADWDALAECLGGLSIAGTPMKMTGNIGDNTGYWSNNATPPFPYIPGTNTSGFGGLPTGNRIYNTGGWQNINQIGYWWSATEGSPGVGGDAYYYSLRYNFTDLYKSQAYKNYAQAVRFVKDI